MVFLLCGALISGARLRRSSFSIPLLFFAAIVPAVADTNYWTKPSSGYWEEQAFWSLGALPNATQSVVFNNPGWKALAIGPNTARNFPGSMPGFHDESDPVFPAAAISRVSLIEQRGREATGSGLTSPSLFCFHS